MISPHLFLVRDAKPGNRATALRRAVLQGLAEVPESPAGTRARAVLAVLDGRPAADAAREVGQAPEAVEGWVAEYAARGLAKFASPPPVPDRPAGGRPRRGKGTSWDETVDVLCWATERNLRDPATPWLEAFLAADILLTYVARMPRPGGGPAAGTRRGRSRGGQQ